MKYIVWVKEDGVEDPSAIGRWLEQGDGPLTKKEADRIAREIRRDCRCPAKVLPLGMEANRDL